MFESVPRPQVGWRSCGISTHVRLKRRNELARTRLMRACVDAPMIKPSPDDKVYPVIKLATVVDALAAEGIPAQDALAGARLSREAMSSPATRISLNQVIECYRNAAKLSREPHFSYHAGLRFHLSAYGMYGFAILSSMSYRQTMQFAENIISSRRRSPNFTSRNRAAAGSGRSLRCRIRALMVPFISFWLKCSLAFASRFTATSWAHCLRRESLT
jgi:hypothetical protein